MPNTLSNVQMFVFYPNEDKVGVKTIKTFAERMKSEGVARALMVVQANLTPFAKQCLTEMQPKYNIEVVGVDCYITSLCCLPCTCLAVCCTCSHFARYEYSPNLQDRVQPICKSSDAAFQHDNTLHLAVLADAVLIA